jgi:Flp pilus assembly protein TadD
MNSSNLNVTPQNDQNSYNISGVVNADNGNFEEALNFFNKAIESDPNNYAAYFNRASVRMHFGDIEGARLDFIECEKLHENNSMLV